MLFVRPLRKSWLYANLVLDDREKHQAVFNSRFVKLVEQLTLEVKGRDFPVFFDSPLARWVEACLSWVLQDFSFLLYPTDISISPLEFAQRIRSWGDKNPSPFSKCDYAASVLEALAELSPQEQPLRCLRTALAIAY